MSALSIAVGAPSFAVLPVHVASPEVKACALSNSEARLLARLRNRERGAFEELVRKNHSAMIRMALVHVADRAVAEEVVQDAWLAVLAGLDRFEGRSSLRTWLFGILIHKAKDRGVRERRHVNFSQLEDLEDGSEEGLDPSRFHPAGELAGSWALPPQPWDERTPEKLLANKQAVEVMVRAIEELPKGLREVLIMRDIEGMASEEICALLKLTETNLYVRLHRARERVRRALEVALVGPR
jgi:RNA polymerase sigma-70 factor (ECF subfamily)